MTHCDVWKCLSHCKIHICSSQCDIMMFGRFQFYYAPHITKFRSVWHIATSGSVHHIATWGNVFHIVMTGWCGTHCDMYLGSLHCDMYLCVSHCDTTIHVATTCLFSSDCDITMFCRLQSYYVHNIVTLLCSPYCNTHHIAMLCVRHSANLLCLVDFNVTMFNT